MDVLLPVKKMQKQFRSLLEDGDMKGRSEA